MKQWDPSEAKSDGDDSLKMPDQLAPGKESTARAVARSIGVLFSCFGRKIGGLVYLVV